MLERVAQELPIFPLPGVVLMPGALLPLHVFEPRYRELVRHVREGDGLMGIATLKSPPSDHEPAAPPIWPEIGVGQVVAWQPMPDGRCNIVLQSVGCVLLEEELPSPHPFRLVRGRPHEVDLSGLGSALAGLQIMVLQLGAISPEAAAEAQRLVQLEGTELVDSLARMLFQDDEAARRAYLAAGRVIERVDRVKIRLADFMAAADPSARA